MLDRIQPYQTLDQLLQDCPKDQVIGDNLIRAWSKINSEKYKKIVCKISGGADSDIVIDICTKCDKDRKIDYVWFDTGLEYQATKDHLKYLEEKYSIKIRPYKAMKPIPLSCKEYGQPFLNKRVSDYMSRLQRYNFQWDNETFDVLYEKYPKCKTALKWWCNQFQCNSFNINNNKWLKEYIIKSPPWFKISDKCCKYAKKDVGNKVIIEGKYQLDIIGVRRAEGGARAHAYKSCFDENNVCDNYRPIFWYTNFDKVCYENNYKIMHSRCYTEYGLRRTGCAGCPYGKDFEFELQAIKEHEPKLFKAVNNIFGESYEYTRKYREFVKMMNKRKDEEENGRQMSIFDYI